MILLLNTVCGDTLIDNFKTMLNAIKNEVSTLVIC